ncbi:acetyl-CoA carboxylase biotin carboxyl carrier protein subunit [Pseudonocardia sp. ICBG1293]|uniref:acetyl-CoA carboxylase biotin carboxyl carrier protein subunit n=1 Tax=Pseudonocardia sp. ICBG1293 TaxID=2844382 RepID=UPI001CCBF02A|nr:acetyl-CoA carboxylase biotin carboxyl carrier protein subunit [Pseudonocardia sp. ICBG1293]
MTENALTAEIPAVVLELHCTPGRAVAAGETVALLESMKMEIPVLAPHEGVVTGVHVGCGDFVRTGTALVTMDVSRAGAGRPPR